MRRTLGFLVIIIGLLAYIYPTVGSIYNAYVASTMVSTYAQHVVEVYSKAEDSSVVLEKAQAYNATLPTGVSVVTAKNDEEDEEYESLLAVSGSLMGYVEIPKISQKLPIYHYANEKSLVNGVGHLKGSSLPVGGIGTNTVLTGHRGLPTSMMFTRLDELEVGDLFYINVLDETLVYQICSITTILPTEVEGITIDPDRDLATLITCTPYGINTHRLVIVGERVNMTEEEVAELERVSDAEVVTKSVPLTRLYVAAAASVVLIIGWKATAKKKSTRRGKEWV